MKNKKNRTHQLAGLLDIPLDMVADVPRFIMNDNKELTIENYKYIEGYEPEEIRLRSKHHRITVSGKELQIIAITDEEIFIRGTVSGLSII
ncbi:MAG: sporulation protein YqfC [Ruminococcaceae bacterium]|nr:sporulation protein YqfC [Oscillospiraceae bacterium]